MHIKSLSLRKLHVAMLAGAALVSAAPVAHAVVITYSGPAIPITNDINGLYLNVVTGLSGSATAPSNWDVNVYNNGTSLSFFARTADTSNGYVGTSAAVSALAAGTTVGAASSFTGTNVNGGFLGTNFFTPGDRYFGFRFTNESTGAVNYGWALLSTGAGASNGFPLTLVSYAYENAGSAITVPVPEPSTYALMALGLAGVAGFAAKKRRNAA